jgi:hypothetical protein
MLEISTFFVSSKNEEKTPNTGNQKEKKKQKTEKRKILPRRAHTRARVCCA